MNLNKNIPSIERNELSKAYTYILFGALKILEKIERCQNKKIYLTAAAAQDSDFLFVCLAYISH